MKIGDRVYIDQDVELHDRIFKSGHQFTIVGEDYLRGFDLKDDDGNMLCETRFVKLKDISESRDHKINIILNGK